MHAHKNCNLFNPSTLTLSGVIMHDLAHEITSVIPETTRKTVMLSSRSFWTCEALQARWSAWPSNYLCSFFIKNINLAWRNIFLIANCTMPSSSLHWYFINLWIIKHATKLSTDYISQPWCIQKLKLFFPFLHQNFIFVIFSSKYVTFHTSIYFLSLIAKIASKPNQAILCSFYLSKVFDWAHMMRVKLTFRCMLIKRQFSSTSN